MYQDEYILGFQEQLTDHCRVGVRGIYRDLKAAIDDKCDYTVRSDADGYGYDRTTGSVQRRRHDAVHAEPGLPVLPPVQPG